MLGLGGEALYWLDMATVQLPPRPELRFQPVAKRASFGLPIVLPVILGYLLLLPPQTNMSAFGSALPVYRIFLIGATLLVIPTVARRDFRFAAPDILVVVLLGWISLAMYLSSGLEESLTATLAHFTDIVVAYFFARITITDLQALRKFLILMLPGIFVLGTTMAAEAITHTHIFQSIFSSLTGKPVVYLSSPRFGLMRAMGAFPHPILAGTFLVSFLPLYALAGFRPWPRLAGMIASLCSVFTVSSVALLAIVASLGLLIYNWLTKLIANLTWSMFFFVVGTFVFLAELGTKSGTFTLFIRFASFNATSGYNRILIWRYGTQNVAESPWFGIGYADWARPVWMGDSMDNYWLLTAVRFGIPASVLVGIATLIAALMLMRRSMHSSPVDRDCQRGVVMSLAVFALSMMSASLWLSVHVWFYMLLGLTVSLAISARTQVGRPPQADAAGPSEPQLNGPPAARLQSNG